MACIKSLLLEKGRPVWASATNPDQARAAAQGARWARERQKTQTGSGNKQLRTPAPRRTLSPAARRRIAAAQKARWAKFRAQHDMRKLDNGHLTVGDKATLNQQQNELSRQIYRDKHNAPAQNTNPKTEVGRRQENQQDRIAQGIRSGQLTARATARLEGRERTVNREVARDRAANGGKLTAQERAQVNRQQNRDSRAIYRDKHNARKQ